MDIVTKIIEQVNSWKNVPELDFLELGKKEFPEDAFLFEGCKCPAEYEDTYELVASLNKLPEWSIANYRLKRLGRERRGRCPHKVNCREAAREGGLGHLPVDYGICNGRLGAGAPTRQPPLRGTVGYR